MTSDASLLRRLPSLLCLLLLLLLFIVPLVFWVASMVNLQVVNPLSSEAIRWLFKQGPLALVSVHLALVILALTAFGAVRESGWWNAWHDFRSRAFIIAVVVFCVVGVLLLVPVIIPRNSLLSVTGSLFPSPWLCGFPLGLCCGAIFSSVVFALVSQSWQGIFTIPRLLSIGLTHYGLWVVDFMMASFLLELIRYYLS